MSGAYSDLKELVGLRFQARNLALFQNNRSRSLLAGCGTSPFKGRGVDFEEVRAYQYGDDIRSIDWRVTARRSKPHTKIFQEERERPVLIVLDQSHSLFFGSQLHFKSVTAAETCALLAWATLNHGDRIGGVIFDENSLSEVRPKRSKQTLMHLLHKVNQHNEALSAKPVHDSGYLAKALRHARRVSHPGTHIFVISDFSRHNDETLRHLTRLSRHCELMAIQVSDPLESELPRPGRYEITNGVHRQTIITASRLIRKKYRSHFEQRQASLQEQLTSLRVPYISLSSAEDTATQLLGHFGSSRVRRATQARGQGQETGNSVMMNQTNPFDQLRPNHLPDPVSWFPPAPGWWLGSLLILILLSLAVWLLIRIIRRTRYRRQAKKAVAQLWLEYQQHGNDRQFAHECGSLLKRTALTAYPEEQIARLHGQDWLRFLADKSNNPAFLQGAGTVLGEGRYSKEQPVDVQSLHTMTLSWIRKHHA